MAETAASVSDVSGAKVGFWRRTGAYLVDAIGVSIVASIIGAAIGQADLTQNYNVSLLLGLAYFLYFWSSYGGGQTLGMKLLGIKVVKTDGSQLSITTALIRYVGLLVSFFVLFIGVIWVAFDPQKQGWHDKIASTYVVRA